MIRTSEGEYPRELGVSTSSSARRSKTSRGTSYVRSSSARDTRVSSPASARSSTRSSSSTIARARSGSRSIIRLITFSGMKRSSWSCLISLIRSTKSGG